MLIRFRMISGFISLVAALIQPTLSNAQTVAGAGVVSVATPVFSALQSAPYLDVVVSRSGGSSGAIAVDYSTVDGNATADVDYRESVGNLVWLAGDVSSRVITIPLITTAPFAGSKSFFITLSSPSGGASVSNLGTAATATIVGTGTPAAGSLTLSQPYYTSAQAAAPLSVTVIRAGGSTGAVSVNYTTVNGNAVAGVDFVQNTGVVSWANGDSTPRVISIPLQNTVPYAGSKTFFFELATPAGGANLGSQSAASILLSGTMQMAGAPSGLRMTGQSASSISLSWVAPPASSLAYYKIYRNGVFYATSSGSSFTDYGAVDATNGSFTSAANIYSYAVSAVSSSGVEGPQTSQTSFNVYSSGVFGWGGDYSFAASASYQNTSGVPESGPYDIAVNILSAYGGFQPYAGNTVPLWDLEAGSFGYLSMDLKPTISGQDWRLSAISRLPPGDVYPWAAVDLLRYGPKPVPGVWATYKVPLSALSIGKTYFQGSISGNTLTVTEIDGGVGVDAGGFVSGLGVQPGTYITGYNATGGPGTYTVTPAQNVAATAMTEQRTAVYKVGVIDETGANTNVFYVDNVVFTAN